MNDIGSNRRVINFKDGNSCLIFKEGNNNYEILYINGEFKITNNNNVVSLDYLINSNSPIFNYIESYFINDLIKNYINDNDIFNLLGRLSFIKNILIKKFNNEKIIEFLNQIILTYESSLIQKKGNNHITNIKFFISNIVPIFIEQLQHNYNNIGILSFMKDILKNNDINYQSKIIEGLMNYTEKNINNNFLNDILNIDLTQFSLEEVARLYSVLSRQNANKKIITILDKINDEYISKLSKKDTNLFSKFLCKNINDINFFEEKSNINIANYSQCLVNYFNYIINNKDYSCFKGFFNAIKKEITDVDFINFKLNDKIETSLIEQAIKSIKSKKQKQNLNLFFAHKNKKYKRNIVSSIADSVFCDGINSRVSMDFIMHTSNQAFNTSINNKIKNIDFSNDRKNRIIVNNKQTLLELSKIKLFRKEFLNEDCIFNFLINENINIQDKKFLLNFYIEVILFDNKKLSKNRLIGFFQKKFRYAKIKEFKEKIDRKIHKNKHSEFMINRLLKEKETSVTNKKHFAKKIYTSARTGFIASI